MQAPLAARLSLLTPSGQAEVEPHRRSEAPVSSSTMRDCSDNDQFRRGVKLLTANDRRVPLPERSGFTKPSERILGKIHDVSCKISSAFPMLRYGR